MGTKTQARFAGPKAMQHVDAEEHDVTPKVHFAFREATDQFSDTRELGPGGRTLPEAAKRVLDKSEVPFVIRGHTLRGFVEVQTAEERYQEVAGWFGLDSLLAIQKNLRGLRRKVRSSAESSVAKDERLRDLARITSDSLKEWNEVSVLQWLNNEIAVLDSELKLEGLSNDDENYLKLKKRKEAEEENVGLAALNRLIQQVEAIWKAPVEAGGDPEGAVPGVEGAVAAYANAVSREADERAKASQTVFNEVWSAAGRIFADNDIPLDHCPVCDTRLSETPDGSRNAVRVTLDKKRSGLKAYKASVTALDTTKTALEAAVLAVGDDLERLATSLDDTQYLAGKSALVYLEEMLSWELGKEVPDGTDITAELKTLHNAIVADKKRIEADQGKNTYVKALESADGLIELKTELLRISRRQDELTKLDEQLNLQAHSINKAIADHTQWLLSELMEDVNKLYKQIQGGDENIPPIRLELPDPDDVNQQRIQLLIDFADNCQSVVPNGYLSDSQVNALALSIRLAAIKRLNVDVPIIVLDDVVTSYDADHRKNIAAMLAREFADFQLVILTHDERFFMLLQDHLQRNNWLFRRITDIAPEYGPSFHDHRTPDEVIEAKLDVGERAANEIRQAEEEWLLDTCRGFRVKVDIRPIDRPYKYDRSELAGALAAFLKKANIQVPVIHGIENPFLASLQRGEVENFGSHFSDNPNESASVGDDRARWNEFKLFRDAFACSDCGRVRFIRPKELEMPVCKKCQTVFALKVVEQSSGSD